MNIKPYFIKVPLTGENFETWRKSLVLNIVCWLTVLVFALFTILRFIEKNYTVLYINIAVVLIFTFLYVYLQKSDRIELVGKIFFFVIFIHLSYRFQHIDTPLSSMQWSYTIPFLAIWLINRPVGTLFSLLFPLVNYFGKKYINQATGQELVMDPYILKSYLISYLAIIIAVLLTESIRLELQSRHQKSLLKLKKMNAELEQFVLIGTHHLQEPLRNIISYVQLLQKRYIGKLGKEADEYINYSVDGSVWMKSLISGLTEYTQVGETYDSQSHLDCNEILKIVMCNLDPLIVKSNASVRIHPLPAIWADKQKIVLLFQHLIINAMKFCPHIRPEIQIKGEVLNNNSSGSWAGLYNQNKGRIALFSIIDNGIGIAEEYYSKIFDIFERLHKRSEYSGTGIGLALCKKIVQSCGGKIWISSKIGEGSTFYFTISMDPT